MHHIFVVLLLVVLTALPAAAFDHTYAALRDSVLTPFVSEQGVNYEDLRGRTAALDRFLEQCAQVTFEEYQHFTRAEQMAFLINLYNAATLKLVCDHWPLSSLRDTGGILSSPWTKRFIRLFGRTVGLGQIQHDILRPEFREPRIHFALCMAARSSPRLRSEPYLPERIDEQLEAQTAEFMTARHDLNRFENGTLYLSAIFRWYSPDFGKQAGVRAFARKYFPDVTAQTKIVYTDFDWSLNRKP
jgi:hypothetical protein